MDSLTSFLSKTSISHEGVSFAGRGLKLNTEEDAQEIVHAINTCKQLQFLNLEGNTLGINASQAISQALAKHSEFKRALWKDLFTGRMKDEIPIALRHLGDGLLLANARLIELDLSDNAFGPIGVEGLATLLKSSCCFELQELRLNNNGLGIGGGKMLASALLQCYKDSKSEGKALALKVFVAGRNRLENPGATALAEVFQTIGTLEEIVMPQNGIYVEGIAALAHAFKHNRNLQVINLNDNTITHKGAEALANCISELSNLKLIDFGDCLLKTKGILSLAQSLQGSSNIEEICLDCNEVKLEGALQLLDAIEGKRTLKKLSINGNSFGEEGCELIKTKLLKLGKLSILESLDDDEGDAEDDDSEQSGSENDRTVSQSIGKTTQLQLGSITVDDFMSAPTLDNFNALGNERNDLFVKHANMKSDQIIENSLEVLMNVASLINQTKDLERDSVIECCEFICNELFQHAHEQQQISIVNNTLLVYLKLLKTEDKKFTVKWDINSCCKFLAGVVKKTYFPSSTKDILKFFIEKDIANKKQDSSSLEAKNNLLLMLK